MSIEDPVMQNPFPGLRPFSQVEDYLFFGREEQTIELLRRLSDHRFVAVVGTSGSGKSSLVRCGLLSELLGGKMRQAGAAWEIAVTHPGGNPLALLAESLLAADLYDPEAEHARENLLATLSRSQFGLVEAIRQSDIGDDTNFLLVVDQFEEIFRFHEAGQSQKEVANEFVSLLLEAVTQTAVPIYVVLTMRSDFIGECGQFEGLAETVNRGEFLIPQLNREQFKRVIEGPIKVAGGQMTPRLLQRLLNDLGQQADQLPCLQHALMRTWSVWAEKGDAEAIDLDDYQRVGKMSQALSIHADEIYESLASDRERELCRGLFQALTVQESENRGIRRPQRLGSLCRILQVPALELLPVIDAYRQSGVTFLMPAPEVKLGEQTIIDISHESLMRVWNRLRLWVEEESQAAGIYRRLSESAALHEQGETGLYRDPELGIALAWRQEQRPNEAWAARYRPGFRSAMDFLEASERAKVAEAEAQEAARQRELAQARQVAEVRRRSARRLRWMVSGLAVVALLAVIATINAVSARRAADDARVAALASEQSALENAERAEMEAERARQQEAAAKKAEEEATAARQSAEAATDAFEQQLYLSDMTLADHSYEEGNVGRVTQMLLDHVPPIGSPDDPRGFEWFHLWAGAHRASESFEPERGRGTQNQFGVPVLALAVSPDGRKGAASYRDAIAIFDTESHEELSVVGQGNIIRRNAYNCVGFSPDGTILGAVTEEGDFQAWNAETYAHLGRASTSTILHGVTYSPTEPLAASGGQDGCLYFWRTDPWEPLDPSEPLGIPIRSVAFSPDGSRIIVGGDGSASDDGTGAPLMLWDFASGEVIAAAAGLEARVNAVAWSPDGESLASAHEDGTVRVWDAELVPVTTLRTSGPVQTLAFSPDGTLLAIGMSRGNTIRVLATDTWELVTELKGRSSALAAIAFVGDTDTLLAGGDDGQLQVWDVARAMTEPVETVRDDRLRTLLRQSDNAWVGEDGKTIYCWSSGAAIERYDLASRQVLAAWNDGATYMLVELSDSGRFLAAATADRQVQIWNTSTVEMIAESDLPAEGDVADLAISSDGSRASWLVFAGERDGSSRVTLSVQDTRGEERIEFGYDNWGGIEHALSPDGKRLFARRTLEVDVYDIEDLTAKLVNDAPSSTALMDSNTPHKLVLSPDGQVTASLASAMLAGRITNSAKGIQLHNREGEPLHNLTGHSGQVNCATFSLDGRRLFSGGQDGTIRVWDVRTGDLLLTLRGHSGPVHELGFAGNANTLVSLSRDDGRARIWHAPTKSELETDVTFWTELAQHLVSAGDPEAARNAYGQAVRLAPGAVQYHRLRGDLAMTTGLSQAVVDDYLRVIALGNAASDLVAQTAELAPLHPLVANQEEQLLTWRYTYAAPAEGWNQPGFDASTWELGRSPMGNRPENRTPWLTKDIWLRFEFQLDQLPTLPLVIRAWNDDDAEFYFNGVLASQRSYSGMRYRQFRSDPAAVDALRPGRNVLAIHCRDNGGATARIDAGLYIDRGPLQWAQRLSAELKAEPDNPYLLVERMQAYHNLGDRKLAANDAKRLISLLRDPVEAEMRQQQVKASPSVGMLARAIVHAGVTDDADWQVLSPIGLRSAKGATLTRLSDGSVLAAGPNETAEMYFIEAETAVEQIAAIRLEALTHPSLPEGGPGRASPKAPGIFAMLGWEIHSAPVTQGGVDEEKDAADEEIRIEASDWWADHTMDPDDVGTNGYWNITYGAGKSHVALFRVDPPVPHPQGNRLTFHMRFNSDEEWPGQNLGRFRLSVASAPAAFEREQLQESIDLTGGGWSDLANAFYLVGDQEALDQLLALRPEGAGGLADLFAQIGNWRLALEAYNRAITANDGDAKLLVGRSRVYVELGELELADADLKRAVTIETAPQAAFNQMRMAKDWRVAAAYGWRLLQENPTDSIIWLKLGSALVMAGDRDGYAKLCEHMVVQQSPTFDAQDSGRVIKVSLLLPDVIDIGKIPAETCQQALDQGEQTSTWRAWAWPVRGLLAYREGDPASALDYTDRALAEEVEPNLHQRALVLAVRALALAGLERWSEAATDMGECREIVDGELNALQARSMHDVYIPLILLREAESLLATRQNRLQEWAENGQWSLIAQDYFVQLDGMENTRAPYRPRGKLLQEIIWRGDGVFDAMIQLRPDNTLLHLARARDLAVRRQWDAAATHYAKGVVDTPDHEEYYEHAATLLLADQKEQYRQVTTDLGKLTTDSGDPFDQYAAARAAMLSPESPIDPQTTVAWAQQAADAEPQPWRQHVLGVALYRAGQLDRAAELLETLNAGFGWGHELNDIGLCLIHIELGDLEAARQHRNEAQAWIDRTEPGRGEGGGRNQSTDWLELQVLLREADARLTDPTKNELQ